MLRAHDDSAPAVSGAALASAELHVLEPRAVHARAAPRRRSVPPQPGPVPQLLHEVRRGDVGGHHAVHASAFLNSTSSIASRTHHTDRDTTSRTTSPGSPK